MEPIVEFKVGDKVWIQFQKLSTIVNALEQVEDIKGHKPPVFRNALVLNVTFFMKG